VDKGRRRQEAGIPLKRERPAGHGGQDSHVDKKEWARGRSNGIYRFRALLQMPKIFMFRMGEGDRNVS
jgi:hypothetical protein